MMIDHHWKGQDHLQQLLEHLPSSTSCSHTQAPKEAMKKKKMMVKILVKDADYDRNADKDEYDDDDANRRKKDYDKSTNQSISR